MPTATLDDLIARNEQLVALRRADIPLDCGLEGDGDEVATALAHITAAIARRVSQGMSLAAALEIDDPIVPAAYRCLMRVELENENWSRQLRRNATLRRAVDTMRAKVADGWIYPLLVCGMVYGGLILFAVRLVPVLERFHREMRLPRGWALECMTSLRDTLPWWATLVPIVALAAVVTRRSWQAESTGGSSRRRRRNARTSPGHVESLHEWAQLAERLAALVDAGVSPATALRLAGDACREPAGRQVSQALASAWDAGQTLDAQNPETQCLPPLMRWALTSGWPSPVDPHNLRIVAETYQQAAQCRLERRQIVVPLMACAVVGGGATLLYGMALFLPVVDLLRQLSP